MDGQAPGACGVGNFYASASLITHTYCSLHEGEKEAEKQGGVDTVGKVCGSPLAPRGPWSSTRKLFEEHKVDSSAKKN